MNNGFESREQTWAWWILWASSTSLIFASLKQLVAHLEPEKTSNPRLGAAGGGSSEVDANEDVDQIVVGGGNFDFLLFLLGVMEDPLAKLAAKSRMFPLPAQGEPSWSRAPIKRLRLIARPSEN